MYLINKDQFKECNLFFGGIDLEHYFNTGWCVAKNEGYFNSYLNKSSNSNDGYIVWIQNSDNKPFALLHVRSCQFKNTSDKSIKDKSPDVLDGLFKFVNVKKYNKKDFIYYYIPYIKTKYPNLTELEIQFKLNNIKYDKETNIVDLQNKPFKFTNEYLNSEGTFDFKFINWPTDYSSMFSGCSSLTHLPDDFTIPEGVTDCNSMFSSCTSLTYLSDNFKIPEGVTNCNGMFEYCTSLTHLPESFTIPSSVITCYKMFTYCKSLTHLSDNFTIPSSVTNCNSIFDHCTSLTYLPDNFNIPNTITDISHIFDGCNDSIKQLYLNKIKNNYPNLTKKEFDFKLMGIKYDEKTNTIDLQNKPFKFINKYLNSEGSFDFKFINWPTDCSEMFKYCHRLKSLPEDFTIPEGVTNCSEMFAMFTDTPKLTHLPNNFTIPNSVTDCSRMFECSSLTSLPDNFTIPQGVTNCQSMFRGCMKLIQLPDNFTIPNSVINCERMFKYCTSIIQLPDNFTIPNSVTNCKWMFSNCTSLLKLPNNFIVPQGANCYEIFINCKSLIKLKLLIKKPSTHLSNELKDKYRLDLEIIFNSDGIKYDKETNTVDLQNKPFKFKNEYLNSEGTFDFKFINWSNNWKEMFKGCNKLKYLPNDFTIPEGVTDCNNLFNSCISLVQLPDNFTIPQGVVNCNRMFDGCTSLFSLPDNFTIPQGVVKCRSLFANCIHLITLPDNFTLPNSVKECARMFYECKSLVLLSNNFTIPEGVTSCHCMFWCCKSLKSLPDNFTIPEGVTDCSYMFYNCYSIKNLYKLEIPKSVNNPNNVFDFTSEARRI